MPVKSLEAFMDCQATVDAIRSFLATGGRQSSNALAMHSQQYALACQECNDRLRRCTDALRRNLRGDAILLAEAEPNLLDRFALLDFPELPTWKETCLLNNELAAPPDLLIEMGAALNEAYALEQPLAGLMAHHRLLALARAPLKDRLVVMRRLAELDSASSFWDDDLRNFERVRGTEMRAQLSAALKDNDDAAIDRLYEESERTKWRESLPADFRKQILSAVERLTNVRTTAKLRAMLPALNDAYSAMSYDDCNLQISRWNSVVAEDRYVLPSDLQEQIEPIQNWVREEGGRREHRAGFVEACDRLQQAIDTDRPTPALERAYQATLGFHLDLPEEIFTQYRKRMSDRVAALKFRRRAVFCSIGAGFLLLAGIAGVIAYQYILSEQVNDAQKVLVEALADVEQNDLPKGQSLRRSVTELHPRLLESPAISKSLADLDAAILVEKQRQVDFNKHFQAATAAGLENPNKSELQLATETAKTATETAQVELLTTQVNQHRAQVQAENDRRFSADGASLASEIAKQFSPTLLSEHPDEYATEIQQAAAKVTELRNRVGVSTGLKTAQLSSLDAVLERRQQDLRHAQSYSNALTGLRHFEFGAKNHANALRTFLANSPDNPRCSDFQRVLQQLPAELGLEAWSDLTRTWGAQILPGGGMAAKTRLAEVEAFLDSHPNTPLSDSIKSYQGYLRLCVQTTAEDGPLKGKLSKLLNNPVVSQLNCLDTVDGTRYYVLNTTRVKSNQLEGVLKEQTFDAITSPDLAHPTPIKLRNNFLRSVDPKPSPQSALAETLRSRLSAIDSSDWDLVGLNVIEAIRTCDNLNPVLRAILLQHVLQLNDGVDKWSGEVKLADSASLFEAENVEDMEWLDPAHATNPDSLRKIHSICEGLPTLAIAQGKILRQRQEIVAGLRIGLNGEGVLLKNATSFEVASQVSAEDGSEGWAINSSQQLVKIGSVREGLWVINKPEARSVLDGALVFVFSSKH